jgi:hypothetical protein
MAVKKTALIAAIISVPLVLASSAFAGDSFNHDVDHAQAAVGYSVPAAIDHAETAISNAAAKDAEGLVSEAKYALKAAKNDVELTGDKYSARAVHCLEAAIGHGEKGHFKAAIKHLENAISHLRAADD